MSRRFKGTVAALGVSALCLSLFAAGVSGKSKIRRVGTSTQIETSTHGKRNIVVTGVIQSSVAKCERDRSVLLYQDGPGGTYVDEDGFLFITDRLSRFSKIGGEMVPHIKIEEAVNAILQNGNGAVTAVPDDQKGERLVVIHTRMAVRPDEISKRLAEAGMANLWIPSADSFLEVESIPVLGSGKTDLKAVADLAKRHFWES